MFDEITTKVDLADIAPSELLLSISVANAALTLPGSGQKGYQTGITEMFNRLDLMLMLCCHQVRLEVL